MGHGHPAVTDCASVLEGALLTLATPVALVRSIGEPDTGWMAQRHEVVWANPAWCELLELPSSDLPLPLRQLVPVADDGLGAVASAIVAGRPWTGEALLATGDTRLLPTRLSCRPVAGAPGWTVLAVTAATEEASGVELAASEERFRALASSAPVAVLLSEAGVRLGYVNDRFAELCGLPIDRILGLGWLDAFDPDDVGEVIEAATQVLDGGEADVTVRVRQEQETWVRLRLRAVALAGRGAGFVGTLEDVTQARQHEAELVHLAHHDPLTGLPNRAMLTQQLDVLLASSWHRGLAVLFIDLDNFKVLNDGLGHAAGDRLLRVVAARLSTTVRAGDFVARYGGDEFVALCPGVRNHVEANRVAQRIAEALGDPAEIGGRLIRPTASVGVVLATAEHRTGDDVLRDADIAMYEAKRAGRARAALYTEQVGAKARGRLDVADNLRSALGFGAIDVHYQPIIDTTTGCTWAVEALLRWTDPQRGPVSPLAAIETAVEHGFIAELGEHVLARACRDLATIRRALGDRAPEHVTVNVAAAQLTDPHRLIDAVVGTLADAGLRGSDLYLELTETSLMTDPAAAARTVSALADRGVLVAIDDFGTGFSSLERLRRLPVRLLKVDRAFVAGVCDDEQDRGLVAAIAGLGRGLGMDIVAEGVERAEQLAAVTDLGCRFSQGWLHGRPAPIDQLLTQLLGGEP